MKLILGGIMHETHSFSVEPTTVESLGGYRGDELLAFAGTNHSVGGVLDGAEADGIDIVPTFFVDCVSTGTPDRETFETLTDELVDRIGKALPADGIVLTLHGAMVAEGSDSAEAEIVRRIRNRVGTTMPIAVTLDFHANLGPELVELADIITVYDTYPHIDAGERAREAVRLLIQVIRGEIQPTRALAMPPMMPAPQAQFTHSGLFADLFEIAHGYEASGDALSISLCGGFAYSDVPQAGSSVLVTTNDDPDRARAIALEIATRAWDERDRVLVQNVPPDTAVAEAIAFPDGPVMLVDVGDNIGGGTPGDGTVLLGELLRQGAKDATIVMCDPAAVSEAISAGPGGHFRFEVGGKTDRHHGDPVLVEGTVTTITDGHWVHEGPENAGVPVEMGPTALVQAAGVNVILSTIKSMPGDQQQLKSLGIDPLSQHIIVVKAAVRWRGGYGPIAKHAILVDTPGIGSAELTQFPYQQIRRPIFPLDPETSWTPAVAIEARSPQR